jgi:glycosyltransferase involved in cell wall biosynthesis
MTAPSITVLITTHNYGRFIDQAIDSVLSQEFPRDQLQVLVVDDGSTDETSERVKKYGSCIDYFYKPNGGQASALNFGFAKVRGEIVALLDADDLFLPGKLARVAEAFQRDTALGMFYHPYLEWDVQTSERREAHFPLVSGDAHTVPDLFFRYYPHPTSCISFRRTSLVPLLPIPEEIRVLADAYLGNLVPFVSPMLAVPESFVTYRIHGRNHYYAQEQQMSVVERKKRLQKWQIVIDAMRKWLIRNGYTRRQSVVRSFQDRWWLYEQGEKFLIKPPGRLRFFWYVVRENHSHRVVQRWKSTAIRYVTALSALTYGYENWSRMEEWRCRALERITRLVRGFLGAQARPSSKGGARV